MVASFDCIQAGMAQVEDLLNQTFTDHELETNVNTMCQHVIKAGGKRMRPRLVLLCAHATPALKPDADVHPIYRMAAAVELLHTATLVHDDVIDVSPMRRGQLTLNEKEGNHAAVLAGDYLFTRCFALIQDIENFTILKELNYALRMLVVGELFQLQHEGDLKLSLEQYQETIYCKTGVLFELAAIAPAIILNLPQEQIESFRSYGRNLGIAFQIKDDMLDYCADSEELGKNVGTDLKDQRITLPILVALQRSDENARKALIEAIEYQDFAKVKAAILSTNALDACQEEALKASQKAQAALSFLPDSPFKQELMLFATKAIERSH